MLALDSPEWSLINASSGGTGRLAASLLRRVKAGDISAFDELQHQLCHQFTVGAVAYLAMPHLIEIARSSDGGFRVRALVMIGTIVAARAAHPTSAAPLAEAWRHDYEEALADAMALVAGALRGPGLKPEESQELIAAAAALHRHTNLAMHLFLHGGSTDLSCPECGELIEFGESSD
ncbi:MAG: hypothetical protein AAGC60_19520 [Acidobacteriota bacterium]